MKNKKRVFILLLIAILPVFSFAAGFGDFLNQFEGWVKKAGTIIYMLIFIAFFWGVVQFLFGGASDQEKGKQLMIWGIVAIFVVTAIWGIVTFIQKTFGIDKGQKVEARQIIPGL